MWMSQPIHGWLSRCASRAATKVEEGPILPNPTAGIVCSVYPNGPPKRPLEGDSSAMLPLGYDLSSGRVDTVGVPAALRDSNEKSGRLR